MNEALVKLVKESFINTFISEPLLVFSPGRINIIGEHTDYNDGFVFPAAVDKGIVAGFQKSDANTSKIYAVNKSEIIEISLDSIEPLKKQSWGNYVLGVIHEILEKD